MKGRGEQRDETVINALFYHHRGLLNDLLLTLVLRAFRRIVLGCPRLRSQPSQTKKHELSLFLSHTSTHFSAFFRALQLIYFTPDVSIFHMSTLSAVFNSILQGNTCCKISLDIELSLNDGSRIFQNLIWHCIQIFNN